MILELKYEYRPPFLLSTRKILNNQNLEQAMLCSKFTVHFPGPLNVTEKPSRLKTTGLNLLSKFLIK